LYLNYWNFEEKKKVLEELFPVAGDLSNLRFDDILGHNMGDAKIIKGEGSMASKKEIICAPNCF